MIELVDILSANATTTLHDVTVWTSDRIHCLGLDAAGLTEGPAQVIPQVSSLT